MQDFNNISEAEINIQQHNELVSIQRGQPNYSLDIWAALLEARNQVEAMQGVGV